MQQNFNTPLIALIRDSHGFIKIVTAVKLFFFLSTFYFVPSAQAVEQAVEAEQVKNAFHPQGRSNEEKLSSTLQAIKEHVSERKAQLSKRVSEESSLWQDFLNLFGASGLLAEDLDRLESMVEAAEQLHQKTLTDFARLEQKLKARHLPDIILQRHADAVDQYREHYRQFQENLGQALHAESLQDQDASLGELDNFLDKQQFKRRQQPFDPNNLPFSTSDPEKSRKPITDKQQLNDLLGLNQKPSAAKQLLDVVIPPAYAQFANDPTPADLNETIEVQITEAVQAKADELNHNPVEIYNWVRNNVQWQPTWGAVQDSDLTLSARRGNAFDIASLTIALLRASDIPARYAYGTIDVPEQQFRNWIGGFSNINAAIEYAATGGIPVTGVISGGRITKVRLEHIWVEAWVDFFPSRGFKNIEGDSWIPLDASFKQYEYQDGLDPIAITGLDIEQLADSFANSRTVNEEESWATGFDPPVLETAQAQVQQALEEHIDTHL